MMKRVTFFVLKILRYGLIGLVTLLVLAVLILLEENQRGKWAWEKYKREAEARGVSFDWHRFVPPPVPDDQNFAMTPLLKPLFGSDVEYKTTLSKRLELTGSNADAIRPRGSNLAEGRRIDLGKWREFLGQPDILQALKKFDPELDEISAAVRRPHARFPLHYEEGMSLSVSHALPLMNFAKLYQLRAFAALEAGQPERALADVETLFGLAESFRDEPLLISQLVRISILSIGSQVVWEGLGAHRWSEIQLAQLQGRLERIDLLSMALSAMRFERAILPGAVSKLLKDPKGFEIFLTLCGDSADDCLPPEALRFFLKSTMHQNLLAACRFDDKYLLPVINPVTHRFDVGMIKAGKEEIDGLHDPAFSLYTFLIRLGSPAALAVFPKFACMQATIDQAVIACALERYRLAYGAFPDKLDALVPQYLAKLPHDVIDGQPLHYRRTGDGLFLLYSVGWNEADDNGTVGMNAEHHQDIEQGDWVWRYPVSGAK